MPKIQLSRKASLMSGTMKTAGLYCFLLHSVLSVLKNLLKSLWTVLLGLSLWTWSREKGTLWTWNRDFSCKSLIYPKIGNGIHIIGSVCCYTWVSQAFQGKESTYQAGDTGLIPGPGRSPGEGNGNHASILCQQRYI